MNKKTNLLFLIVFLLPFNLFSYGSMEDDDFSYRNIDELIIDSRFASVELRGSRGDELQMQAELPDFPDIAVLHEKRGNTVRVWIEREGLFSGLFRSGRTTLSFTVPQDTEIVLTSASGSVFGEDLESDNLEIRSASGRVELENIEGTLKVSTASGSISVEGIDGEKKMQSASGRIILRDSSGDARLKSSSGSCRIESHKGGLKVDTTSGTIRMISVEGEVDCKSVSGSIRGEQVELTDDASFNTASGSITMDLLNDFDKLSFDLRSVSGSLKVKDYRGKKNLVIEKGGLYIRGKSVSGSQSYN